MAQRLLPNWIKAYLAYTDSSESPEVFHKWTAISALAGAVRRKVYFNMGYFLLYPNMYIVFVGPPGRVKKSSAMRLGRGFMSRIPDISFTTDSVTRERLIQDMSQSFKDGHSSMTAYSSEFASLLTSSGMDMVVFLTDIFDSPEEWSHRTKVGGTNKIKSPYLNLLGCTTPDWIAKAMPLDTIGIGLTSRIVFIYADEPRVRNPFPTLSKEQIELAELLAKDLVSISMLEGEYRLSETARSRYVEWYQARIKEPNTTGDARLNGYFERKPMHLLKLAMLVSASYRDDLIIELSDLEQAMALFNEVESFMPKVFANVGKNPFSMDYEEAMMCVYQHDGPIELGDLLKRMKHSVRQSELEEIMNSLVKMRMVKVEMTPKGVFYSPV